MINAIIANICKGYVVRCLIALVCFTSLTANATVFYVTPDGTGSGTSWSDATTLGALSADLSNTKSTKVVADDTIRMKAGTYTMTAGVTIAKAITVEGGYKGEVDGDLTLADNPVTTLDGANSTSFDNAVSVSSSSGTTRFYRMAFIRCYKRGIFKSGNGSLEMYDCRLANNGATAQMQGWTSWDSNKGIGGRGGLFMGSSSSSYLVLSNCVFESNVYTKTYSSNSYHSFGSGAAILNFKNVSMDDCVFKGNGFDMSVVPYTSKVRSSKASAMYLRSAPITARNTLFIGNSFIIGYSESTGCVELSTGCSGSMFKNCAWIGNQGVRSSNFFNNDNKRLQSAVALMGSASDVVDFENCTIAYNLMGSQGGAAGLIVNAGTANVKNSILFGNVICKGNLTVSDPDIYVNSNGKLNLVNCLTTKDVQGTSVISGDPMFVTPLSEFYDCISVNVTDPLCSSAATAAVYKEGVMDRVMNFDVHLRSADGYFDNSGKYYPKGSTDVTSIAIDAGAIESDYSKEPMPNGGVVNLGCYGNTPEASNSPSGGQPTLVADDVVVTFTEYGQPTITVTPGAADLSKYKAIVTISVTGKVEGSGVIAEETKTFELSQAGVGNGDSIEMAIGEMFEPSSQLLITVNVVADGAQDVVVEKTVSVSGTLPQCYGHGNNNVVHYWADAPGRNDGSSWAHAYRDLSSAFAALTPEKSELWVAGSNVVAKSTATLASSFNSTIRGGFTECCDSLEDREVGAISVLDGNNTYAPFAVSVSEGKTCFVERMKFCRAGTRNITKSGAGNLSMVNCILSDCDKSVQGSGIYLSGGENTFDSCEFHNLKYADASGTYNHAGAAMYATGAKNIILDNCSFTGNGIPTTQNHRDAPGGSAIYSFNTPIIAKETRFVGNVERTEKHSSNFRSAGCVTLNGNCGGSAFTNCFWLGNCGSYSGSNLSANGVGTSTNTATVVVNLSSASSTVDFANCTFAYNMSDSALSSSGILMLKGAGSAVNSIFTGAVTGTCSRVANQVYVNNGASMTLDYCMFDAEGDYGAAEGGTVTASNIMYADPRLVYSRDDFATGGNVDLGNGIYKSNGSGINSVLANANAHLLGGSGYKDEKTGQVVKTSRRYPSPAIDAGKPGYDYSLEPMPNGRRVNLGFYGNTPWATMSDRRGMKIIIR